MINYNFFDREFPEEVEFILKATGLINLHEKSYDVTEMLFTWLIDVAISEDKSNSDITILDWKFEAINFIEVEGSFDRRVENSSSYVSVYNPEGVLVLEFNYDISSAHCCESKLMSMDAYYDEDYENNILNKELDKANEEEDNVNTFNGYTLVKKSTKETPTEDFKFKVCDIVKVTDTGKMLSTMTDWFSSQQIPIPSGWVVGKGYEVDERWFEVIHVGFHSASSKRVVYHISDGQESYLIGEEGLTLVDEGSTITNETSKITSQQDIQDFKEYDINKTGENNMTTQLRTVNITLVDNNTNLKGKAKVVFQKLNYLTEYSDEDTKVNIIATGKVAKAVTEHNEEVRAKTVDDTILRSTGRDVPLKPIELLSDSQLSWNIVTVA